MRALDPESLPRHVDRLYRAAWALCGSREDAEDLVQETFARVLARRRVLRGDDELFYLMRVLRNTFLSARRTASRRPLTVAALDDLPAVDPRPGRRPEQALEIAEVYETIAALPEEFRSVLVAVDVLGLSYREAARALQIREATITTRLFRARKRIASQLAAEPAATEQAAAQPTAVEPTGAEGDGAGPDRRARTHDAPAGAPAGAGARPREDGRADDKSVDGRLQREQISAGGVLRSERRQ